MEQKRKKRRVSLRTMILMVAVPVILVGMLAGSLVLYGFTTRRMKETVTSNAVNLVSQSSRQVGDNLMEIFEEFVIFEKNRLNLDTLLLSREGTLEDTFYVDLYQDVFRIYSAHNNVLDCVFVGLQLPDGTTQSVYYSDDRITNISLTFEEKIGEYTLSSPETHQYVWTTSGQNTVFAKNNSNQNVVSLFKVLEFPKSDARCLIYFGMNTALFPKTVFGDMAADGFMTVLIDGEQLVYPDYTTGEIVQMDQPDLVLPDEKGYFSAQVLGVQRLCVYDSLQLTNWKFAVLIDESELYSFTGYFGYMFLLTTLIILVVVVAVSVFSANLITKPIKQWVDKVGNLNENNLDIRFDDTNCSEIAQFNEGLSYMVQTVKRLLADVAEENEKKRDLEFKLLQEQINPHFLHNTLFSIQELYGMEEHDAANSMMSSLSAFFRKSLNYGKIHVSLQEELDITEDYLRIQQMRHGDLTYRFDVPEALMEQTIVKMTLQPLVENAIQHGLGGVSGGELVIRARACGDEAVLEVADNGAGMPPDMLERLNRSLTKRDWELMGRSYGIRNVMERLLIHYGEGNRLEYSSAVGGGTTVVVRLPLRPAGAPLKEAE